MVEMTKIRSILQVGVRAVFNVEGFMSDIDRAIEEDKKQHPDCSYSRQLYKKVRIDFFLEHSAVM